VPTRRVLVAEDNEANRLLALKQLERLGVQADAVPDGEEAVAVLASTPYDLVFMDCNMPRLNGFAATRRIRQAERAAGMGRVIIVAMTAGAMDGDRSACLAAGMDDYLCKPVMMDDLEEMVARWLPADGPPARGAQAPGDPGVVPETVDDTAVDPRAFEAFRSSLGDDDFVASFVDTFLTQLAVRLESLEASSSAGDGDGLRFVAHTLKSTSAMLGAGRLAGLCAELESSADETGERRDGLVASIRDEAGGVQAALGPWRDRRRAVA
jgi:CheY-like chemotaxis protein/HPt (histidine-containing phosphotransfer) domain-containing protein